jgi:hypothetical protein
MAAVFQALSPALTAKGVRAQTNSGNTNSGGGGGKRRGGRGGRNTRT